MLKRRLFIMLVLLVCFSFYSTSVAFAAGEIEGASPSFGSEQIDGVNNEVYGVWNKDGKDYRGLRSGSYLKPMNGALNANRTGLGSIYEEIVKSAQGEDGYAGKQKVHGNYKRNTNACASCHVTHNASGDKLLFKNTIWNTCTSCHDGTMGILNVFKIGENARDGLEIDIAGTMRNLYGLGAGTFAGPAGEGSSMHMSTGILKLNTAPGGILMGPDIDQSQIDNIESAKGSIWGTQFSCASCHSPHGSYSDRLLHYNPNGIGNELPQYGGIKRQAVTVSKVVYKEQTYYVVSNNNSIIDDYELRDKTPWLYGYEFGTPKKYWTKFYVKDSEGNSILPPVGKAWNDVFDINYGNAYFNIPDNVLDKDGNPIPENAIITMDIAPATVIKMTLGTNYIEGLKEVLNYGEESSMNRFCAACHTDYIYQEGGIFQDKARHPMNVRIPVDMVGGKNNKITCLTCHYAHGTTAFIMLDIDNKVIPDSEPKDGVPDDIDVNNSSALKRYINNGACAKCHSEGF